jgi:hypothetical protein
MPAGSAVTSGRAAGVSIQAGAAVPARRGFRLPAASRIAEPTGSTGPASAPPGATEPTCGETRSPRGPRALPLCSLRAACHEGAATGKAAGCGSAARAMGASCPWPMAGSRLSIGEGEAAGFDCHSAAQARGRGMADANCSPPESSAAGGLGRMIRMSQVPCASKTTGAPGAGMVFKSQCVSSGPACRGLASAAKLGPAGAAGSATAELAGNAMAACAAGAIGPLAAGWLAAEVAACNRGEANSALTGVLVPAASGNEIG